MKNWAIRQTVTAVGRFKWFHTCLMKKTRRVNWLNKPEKILLFDALTEWLSVLITCLFHRHSAAHGEHYGNEENDQQVVMDELQQGRLLRPWPCFRSTETDLAGQGAKLIRRQVVDNLHRLHYASVSGEEKAGRHSVRARGGHVDCQVCPVVKVAAAAVHQVVNEPPGRGRYRRRWHLFTLKHQCQKQYENIKNNQFDCFAVTLTNYKTIKLLFVKITKSNRKNYLANYSKSISGKSVVNQ